MSGDNADQIPITIYQGWIESLIVYGMKLPWSSRGPKWLGKYAETVQLDMSGWDKPKSVFY